MKKLLSREPTPEMVRAAALYYGTSDESLRGIFCYQWDAAPALPEPGEVEQFLNSIAEEYLYLDAPQKEVKARQIRKAADLIAALKAACDKTAMVRIGFNAPCKPRPSYRTTFT